MKKKTFEEIWKNGIELAGKEIVDNNSGIIFDTEAKQRIEDEYNKLRDYTKISYMRNSDGLLDRHKVCACLILAIVKSQPLIYDEGDFSGFIQIFNENLALRVGFSLLANFIASGQQHNVEWIKGGFKFPETEKSREATYQELLGLMLHYDIKNNQYSILAVSNILYMIEEYTKLYYTNLSLSV